MDPSAPSFFCIGFQKTGTTSLGYALHLLGYRVAGSSQIDRTPPIDDIKERAYALAEKYDAFQDMPWCLFYKEFDKAYPDAKFILTLREANTWHGSMRKHFPDKLARLEKLVYDVDHATENVALLNTYVSHIEDVKRHFADRLGKLLMIDEAKDNDWEPICGFLGTKIPSRPYPWLNRAKT